MKGEIQIPRGIRYKYNDYHKEIDGILYKRCSIHTDFYPNENSWFPCTEDYFYTNSKNKSDGLCPECKQCSVKKSQLHRVNNPEWKDIDRERHHERYHTDAEYNLKTKEYSLERRINRKHYAWTQTESGKASGRKSSEKRKVKNHKITNGEWIACKNYFKDEDGDWACIYCGLKAKDHYKNYLGESKLYDLDREHVDDEGSADLDNCVPACCHCNDSKHTSTIDEWYTPDNPKFEQWRYDKIIQWITEDYKLYIEDSPKKRKFKLSNKY
jgi:hypothetical protein